MKLKKGLACICVLALLLGMSVAVQAADGAVSLSDMTVEQGTGTETVEIPLTLVDNPGIAGMTVTVSYDAGLVLTGVKAGDALSGLTFTKPGNLASNPVNLVWDGMEAVDDSGQIATLTFAVPKGTAKVYTVTATPNGVFDNDLNELSFTADSASVTVAAASVEPTISLGKAQKAVNGAKAFYYVFTMDLNDATAKEATVSYYPQDKGNSVAKTQTFRVSDISGVTAKVISIVKNLPETQLDRQITADATLSYSLNGTDGYVTVTATTSYNDAQ